MVLPNQPCPGILEVRFVQQADGQAIDNVIHVDNGSGSRWTIPQIEGLLDVCSAWWNVNVAPLVSNTLTLQEVVGTDLYDLTGLKTSVAANHVGTRANPALPLNVTKAIELFTGNRGRGVNGHFYWPGLTEDEVTGDQVVSNILDAMTLALEVLQTDLIETNPVWGLVVLSRYLNKARRAFGIGRPVVAIESPNTFVSTQKNRLPAHKRKRKPRTTP